ncbi:phage baseplate protein [Geoglobus acetivorans]|uniref:Dit-like phage tail protein N-terminal domain-containing protein n=1 Tax=Geoglobus acetivorans TaxID=565033 RepID=A0A0A7GG13_GEOAI|nr:hypothetical protein GACE_0837 [Geoglobus acetivorans]
MEDILLGDVRFTAIEIVDLSESVVIPEHRVEDGYPIADNIFFQPAEFQLTITLLEEEVETLKQLYESKQPTTLICRFGVFEDVVIQELNMTQGGSRNTFRAVIRVRQILKARAKTAEVPLSDLGLTADESEASGGATATSPLEKDVPDAPTKQENKSWLDSIFDWFGGLWGG